MSKFLNSKIIIREFSGGLLVRILNFLFFKRKLSAEELILLNCDVGEDF